MDKFSSWLQEKFDDTVSRARGKVNAGKCYTLCSILKILISKLIIFLLRIGCDSLLPSRSSLRRHLYPPGALDAVKITIPKSESGEVTLNSVATVSTKGNVLIVNVFDEEVRLLLFISCNLFISFIYTQSWTITLLVLWCSQHTKHVEKAIHAANLPGLSPTKGDSRTIRINIPRSVCLDLYEPE